jgi:hypothetical protein
LFKKKEAYSRMKIISLAFALSVSAVAATELRFQPQSSQGQRSLFRMGDLNGLWGQFATDDYCVEKIADGGDTESDKVKFTPCDNTNPAQMWKFDVHKGNDFLYTGLLYNMEGGCLAIRGTAALEKNLKVLECNRNSAKQHWEADGDTMWPRDNPEFCVTSGTFPINFKAPVVLVDCEAGVYSLDY